MSNKSAKPGFIKQIDASKASVSSWDGWMRSSATMATASLPSTSAPVSIQSPVRPALATQQQKKKA